MLIARAPLRISLAGGGTDLPAYYERYGGLVVSTTIDKYVFVHLSANGQECSQVVSSDYRTFYRHHLGTPLSSDGALALPRAVLQEFDLESGVSLFVASQVPPGTGLGSSSAVAVALLKAVGAFLGKSFTKQELADQACTIELQRLSAPIGKQDQFAAAFGGLNSISFSSNGVCVDPLRVSTTVLDELDSRLLLFFTGTARDSATILTEQQRSSRDGDHRTIEGLHQIRDAAIACRRCLETGDTNTIGELLDEGWRQKKRLAAGITSERIDEAYATAQKRGALGGKITGAGGGGFLLLYCQEVHQEAVTDSLEQLGLRRMDFHLEPNGVSVAASSWSHEAVPTAVPA